MKSFMKYCSIVMLLFLFGCGGGGSTGNATFTMSLSSSTVVAGNSVSSTSQLVSTSSSPVNNIPVTYTSNRPDLIHFASNTATNTGASSITIKTNDTGSTYVVLNIDNSVAIPAEGVSVSIIATSSGLTSTQQLTVTALPTGGGGVVGTTKISLALGATSIQDNNGQTTAIATVTDSAGTALSGQTVVFTVSPSTAPATIVSINGGVTNSSGKAYATITGTTTGSTQNIFIYATISGVSDTQPLAVVPSSITTPSSIPKNIALSFSKTSLQASEQAILTATVTDGSNVPVGNQLVSFSLQPAGVHATITPINNGLTDSTGKAYAIVTATIASSIENAVAYASTGVSPNTVTGSSLIQILPPGATSTTLPAAKVSMIPDKTSLQPSGQAVITTTITDAAGAVVPSEVVTFSVISGPLTLTTPASLATGSDGKVLAVVQASATTNPTYALIKATTANGASQTISMVIAPSGKPQLTLSIAKQTIEATDNEVLATVTVLDSTGAPVNGQSITFSKISGPFTVDPTLVTVTTGADGKATTKLTPTATAFASNILLSMQLTYQGTNYSLVATALVNPAVNLSVVLDSTTVDSTGQIVATATATTASGTPLPGQVVTFTITGPGIIVGQSTTTAADGTSKAVITHDATTTIGNIIVEASIADGETTYSAYATAVPKAATMKLDLSVQSGFTPNYSISGPLGTLTDFTTTTVDGLTSGLPIKAKFTYPDGTPVPNQTVTFTALDPGLFWNSASTTAANGGTVTASTTTSGEAYAVAIPGNFTTSGFIHIQATVTFNGVTYTQVMPIAVQATQVQKSLTLDKAALVISPNESATVNGVYTLKDSNGNPLAGQRVTFSILSGPATITAPATVTTDGSGSASVFIQAGPMVTAREMVYVNAAVTINSVTFNSISTFTVDPSIKLALVTDLAQVGGNGGQVVATATLTDSAGVAISGQNVTFAILTPPGFATITSLTTVPTASTGKATATIQSAATDSTQNVLVEVSTTVAGVTYREVTSFQVVKGVGTLVITAPPTTSFSETSLADKTWITAIPVKLVDANSNPRTNIPVTLSVLSSLGGTYTIVNSTENTDAQGIAIFSIQTPTLSVTAANPYSSTQVVWEAVTNDSPAVIGYATSTYDLTGTVMPLAASPAAVAFVATDPAGTPKFVSVSGGVPSYSVSSSTGDISASIVGSTVTLTLTNAVAAPATPVAATATVTVRDSTGATTPITVSYFR